MLLMINGKQNDTNMDWRKILFIVWVHSLAQAYVAEGDLKRLYDSKREFGYGKKGSNLFNSQMGPKGNINKGKQVQKLDTQKFGTYAKCGRFHKGECRLG